DDVSGASDQEMEGPNGRAALQVLACLVRLDQANARDLQQAPGTQRGELVAAVAAFEKRFERVLLSLEGQYLRIRAPGLAIQEVCLYLHEIGLEVAIERLV